MKGFGFIGGVITGAVVGSAIAMVLDPISDKQRRKMLKKSNQVIKTMGNVMDAVVFARR